MARPILAVVVTVLAGCGGGGGEGGSDTAVGGSVETGAVVVETHTVASTPGVNLKMYRYRPAAGPAYSDIVFLTHGFSVDADEYDLEPGLSLARTLAGAGFDVWSLESRGAGGSDPASILDLPAWKYNFDDQVHVDVHAGVTYALAQSGAPGYFWLGHSWGGVMIPAYVTTHPATPCRGAVLVAPAVCVPYVGWQTDPKREKFWKWVMPFRYALPTNLPLPQDLLAQGAAVVLPEPMFTWTVWMLNWFMGPIIWSPDNTGPEIASKAIKKIVSRSHSTGMRQLMQWGANLDSFTYGPSPYEWHYESSAYYQAHGFQSYSAKLPQFKTPQLWIAGEEDYLVPPGMVYGGYALAGASDKTYVKAGKAAGFAVDYGHGDLMIGKHTPKEIYPLVLSWLQARAK